MDVVAPDHHGISSPFARVIAKHAGNHELLTVPSERESSTITAGPLCEQTRATRNRCRRELMFVDNAGQGIGYVWEAAMNQR
ncbi:hypothetical protein QFW96_17705, partial [Saccharopolyspora sp. TS4A08]